MSDKQLKVGQKVRMTRQALKQGMDSTRTRLRISTGTVITFNPPFVRVLRTGYKTPTRYHIDFWEASDERG
jgi:hypothetical protein